MSCCGQLLPEQLLGAHVSIAGGYDQALVRGEELKATAVQIFTRNQRQWAVRPVDSGSVARFVGRKEQSSVREVYAHGSYLVNLATPDHEILELSLRTTAEELRRCALLGIKLLVIHPGAHKGSGEERGMVQMAGALRELAAAHPGVSLCVETGAGQGTGLCSRFEQLAELVHAAGPETRVCLDTCHVFAAGYDISTPAGFAATLRELERRVGMERLALLHLNDSKGGSGSRLDRHQHIGQGVLGLDVFRCIMQSRELAGLPKIIETPKEDGDRMDQENLELLRSLAGGEPCA